MSLSPYQRLTQALDRLERKYQLTDCVDNEFVFWAAAINDTRVRFLLLEPADAQELLTLAQAVGGWQSGLRFMVMGRWLTYYEAWVGARLAGQPCSPVPCAQ